MTDPLLPEPAPPRRQVARELIGAAAIMCGLIVLAALLGSVDTRLAVGLGAVIAIAGGVYLARGDDEEG